MRKKEEVRDELVSLVIESALDKKAHDLVELDLRDVMEASADYFIICHGDSGVQLSAITTNIADEVKQRLGLLPKSKEGIRNGEWVLLDYGYVVVHVFLKEKRGHYMLEELWSDAVIKRYEEKIEEKKKNIQKNVGTRRKR